MEIDAIKLLKKYYTNNKEGYKILLTHSQSVTRKALEMTQKHPELNLDLQFIKEAAMLHDIGIYQTNAPDLYCFGTQPYICHGILGAAILRDEKLEKHALVCERHTGTGIGIEEIKNQQLPLPLKDYSPQSLEEQLICFADKFFSKTHLDKERTMEQVYRSLEKFGKKGIEKLRVWEKMFL